MAKKGERKTQKRISASRVVKINRKETTWTIRVAPGKHKRGECVPLGVVVRDLLKITNNLKETKLVLSQGSVLVDGLPRKSPKFGIGLFDVVEIPSQKKHYRILFDSNGRFEMVETPEKEKAVKLCSIVAKKAVKGGKIQLETSDGESILEKKTSLRPGDSILVSVPERKILKELKLGKDAVVYIVGGEHVSETAIVKEVIPGTISRPKLVSLEERENKFLTVAENVFVVGEKKPEIMLKVQ